MSGQLGRHLPCVATGAVPQRPVGRKPHLQSIMANTTNPVSKSGARSRWFQFLASTSKKESLQDRLAYLAGVSSCILLVLCAMFELVQPPVSQSAALSLLSNFYTGSKCPMIGGIGISCTIPVMLHLPLILPLISPLLRFVDLAKESGVQLVPS